MITWKRLEAGVYQLYDNGIPQNYYAVKEAYETEKGNMRLFDWADCMMYEGRLVGNGIVSANTLRSAKASIEHIYEREKAMKK